MKVDCHHLMRNHRTGNVKPDKINPTRKQEEKSTTAMADEGEEAYLAGGGNILNIDYNDSYWLVDSGASFHVTPHESFFSSYRSGDFGTVQMGNHDKSLIVGIGDVILTSNTGCKLVLKDVRHVPDMRHNLISTGKLNDDGFVNRFGDGKWTLTKGSLTMARGRKEGTLYLK